MNKMAIFIGKLCPACLGLNLCKSLRKRQQEEEKKKQGPVKVTNEGKYVIFNYFWFQSLFLLM